MEYYCFTEEGLRACALRVLEMFPELRAEAREMCNLLRECVKTEREKLGLDKPRGSIELGQNKEKDHPSQPDLIGSALVAGRRYQAAGWIKANTIRIALLPQHRK